MTSPAIISHISELVSLVLRNEPFLQEKSPQEIAHVLESPKEASFGDIAFPCHVLSKVLRKAPQAIATELAEALARCLGQSDALTQVEAKGPYVNFFINKASLAAELIPTILSGDFLKRRDATGERVMVEYSQPNTHKAFHVGHVRNAALGDSLARILEWLGHDVVPVNYIGDEGTHVAKCLWYYTKFRVGETPMEHRGEFLGELYTRATALLDLSGYTDAPFPGVRVAEVSEVSIHPTQNQWRVLTLQTHGGVRTVVTAATGVSTGDKIAYVEPGVRFAGKIVAEVDKGGIKSQGMVLSIQEFGWGDDNDTVHVLPPSASIGQEVVEVYRNGVEQDTSRPLSEIIREREEEVSGVLQLLERGDPTMKSLWERTREWSLEEFRSIYRWLDCRFDHFFYESECGEKGKEITRRFQARGVFVESDGAVGADLREWNLGFCILIKRDGTALYATRDLALAEQKFTTHRIDRSVYVVDAAQTLHFQQVFKCLELMGYPQAAKCFHLGYAQVVRPEGKMSSRKGNVILFSELKERLLHKIQSEFLEKYRGDWSDEEIEHAGHAIALATIRYGMLKPDNNSVVVFDLEEWTARTGNTGPYMLYAYTRVASILREMGSRKNETITWEVLTHESEIDLMKKLQEYPALVTRAGEQYSPHLICGYVFELSKEFSRMYRFCPVARAETEALKNARACLIEACGLVIEHALKLLGIPVLQKM